MSVKDKILNPDSLLDNFPLPKDLLNRIGITLNQATRSIAINELNSTSGSLKNVDIEKVTLGNATIGNIVVNDAEVNLKNSSASMQNVRTIVELEFTLKWAIDLGWLGSWSDTDSLGSIDIPLELGNLDIPNLDDIDLAIPTINIPSVVAEMAPIKELDLGKVALTAAQLQKTLLPEGGLSLTGLGVGSLAVNDITLPGISVDKAYIKEASPEKPIVLPSANLQNIQVPTTSIPNVQSGSFSTAATASDKSLSVDLGILDITLSVTPTVHLDVEKMLLKDIELSALVKKLSLGNISIPAEIEGITVNGIDLEKISIDSVSM